VAIDLLVVIVRIVVAIVAVVDLLAVEELEENFKCIIEIILC
jgi:hypothetical protein